MEMLLRDCFKSYTGAFWPIGVFIFVDAELTDTPGESYIRSRRMEHI